MNHCYTDSDDVPRAEEFDPTSEKHHVAMIVKWVEPGCTTELQIEQSDGTVTRMTTTEDGRVDRQLFLNVVMLAFQQEMNRRGI